MRAKSSKQRCPALCIFVKKSYTSSFQIESFSKNDCFCTLKLKRLPNILNFFNSFFSFTLIFY